MKQLALAVLGLGLAFASGVTAQTASRHAAGLHGSVVDAATGTPLAAAAVTLELLPMGMVAGPDPGTAGLLAVARQATTGPDGEYRFEGLGYGTYRLRVVRLGYRSTSIDVRYDGPADPRVSVGLEIEPVHLEPLEVFGRPSAEVTERALGIRHDDEGRVRLERMRQMRHLQTDARVLGGADLLEAITLGETDLLRALHRLPGITADDDWSAEPWTRGSRWDETRIYFDGLPLLDPTHAGGALTAVSPDVVGSLTLYPGVRNADIGSASAGVVDLRTRPASGEERLSVLGQFSLLSARASLERPLGPGNGVTFAARRSYIDALTRGQATVSPEAYIPYRFADYGGRWDQMIGNSLKLEVSGLRTEDEVLGDLPHELKGARGRWGTSAIRGTLQLDRGGLRTRITLGESHYGSSVRLAPFDPDRDDLIEAAVSAPLDNEVRFGMARVTVAPKPTSSLDGWQMGLEALNTVIDYDGPAPWPYPGAVNAGHLSRRTTTARAALWGQRRRRLGGEVDFSAGLRVETNRTGTAARSSVTVSPRVTATWQPLPDLRVSGGVGRHYQFEQAVAATGFEMGSALVPGHLWVAAGGEVPAIRADIVSVGAELWLPGRWLGSANAYARISEGQLTPRPDSGYVRAHPVLGGGKLGEDWIAAEGSALGMEIGARKLTGRWTGSVSYSRTHARTTAGGQTFPARGGRPHALDATFLIRATKSVRVGAAYTAMSGASFTRFFSFRCPHDPYPVYCPAIEDAPEVIGFNAAAGSQRTRTYASLDAHLEAEGSVLGLPFGFFLQLRNVLNRNNQSAYRGSFLECGEVWDVDCTLTDVFEPGIPLFPFVGFWMRL